MQSTGTAGTVCSAGTTPTSAAGPGPRHSGSGPAHPVSGLRRLANMRGAEAPRRRDVLLLAAAAWLGLKLQLCVLLVEVPVAKAGGAGCSCRPAGSWGR